MQKIMVIIRHHSLGILCCIHKCAYSILDDVFYSIIVFAGVTNTITAVKNAQMAESPILLMGGAAPTLLKNRGALQDIEQLALFRPLCKYTARINRVKEIIPTIREAIRAALSGTPGPVFIEFPVDTL
jgi:acetolactate synthase-like protein